MSQMDTAYLQRVIGAQLVECLAEVCQKRPVDPVEYIAFWLRKRMETIEKKAQVGRPKLWKCMKTIEKRTQVD